MRDLVAALHMPVHGLTEPDLMDNPAKTQLASYLDLGPALSPWTCLATTRLFQILGTISRSALLTSFPIGWDTHQLERPCPASPGTELSSQHPVPQAAAGPHCALTTDT